MTADYRADTTRITRSLRPIDHDILDELASGRCTPGYLAKQISKQQPYVSRRLRELVDAEIVTHVDRGLYELNAEYKEATDG